MESIQATLGPDAECTGSPNTNHGVQQTQQDRKREPVTSCQNNSDDLQEPRTGDYIMESRIPAESANSSNFSNQEPNTSIAGTSADQSLCNQYPAAPKRQRVVSSRQVLNDKAQQLIHQINEKRKADTVMLADFKKAMEMQVARSYGAIEQSMYQMYEHNGKIMQAKLQELFATLDRIAKLEAELQEFKKALGILYTDIQHPS